VPAQATLEGGRIGPRRRPRSRVSERGCETNEVEFVSLAEALAGVDAEGGSHAANGTSDA
jgi:hypothetical protein